MHGYEIKLAPEDSGSLQTTWLVTCPSLPEVTTCGEDKTDALRRDLLAVEEALACRLSDWDDVPEPMKKDNRTTFAGLSAQLLMKVMLYRAERARDKPRRIAAKVGLAPRAG